MKILITGSEGFIGRNLVQYYLKAGWQVYGADLFEVATQAYTYFKVSRLSPEYEEILGHTKFDVCINAAGSGNVQYSMLHPVSDFESNSLDTIRILDGLRRTQKQCKYLHISSAAVYGNPSRLPVKEEDRIHPISVYGWHKLISETICREYTSVYGLQTAIVRPFSVFGPGLKKQFFWDLYTKIRNSKASSAIELWGTGKEGRDFIFIDDLVRAFHIIMEKGEFGATVYNVANGAEEKIDDVASLFFTEFGGELPYRFNGATLSGSPDNWCADITKLNVLGYAPSTDMVKGIKKLVSWMKSLS